jgi:tagaturonate reductase
MNRRIIQFGTSRFLQAHVDLFVHEARVAGQAIGPIAVVKTTSGHDRTGRVHAMKRGMPFPVRIRGIEAGRVIDELIEVASVDRAFEAQKEWPEVVHCFAKEAEIAVSNVGDAGFDLDGNDAAHDFNAKFAPRSFPAKLLALLLARFQEGGKPLLFLSTELVSGNGSRLAAIVSALAAESHQSDRFRAWLAKSVTFPDTLVDRIVSESIEPVGAVAEPYALWAIRKNGFGEPLRHPAVRLVEDLEPYERLKLHILNLGHTVLADLWLRQGRSAGETVRSILADHTVFRVLMEIYEEEVLPGFALWGRTDECQLYIGATLERFQNPFLEHRLADIAQNHRAKLKNRVSAFLQWARSREPRLVAPRLSGMVGV